MRSVSSAQFSRYRDACPFLAMAADSPLMRNGEEIPSRPNGVAGPKNDLTLGRLARATGACPSRGKSTSWKGGSYGSASIKTNGEFARFDGNTAIGNF